ncbi:MAG: hypothetical protein PHE77_01965 [Candidatus Pacebacteria bacterium]|nr:hypothetical protein [Candidatus Paceibacterota bacterium]
MNKKRLSIAIIIFFLVVSNIIGWWLFAHARGDEQGVVQLKKENNSLIPRVEELEKINGILYANIKETDEWVARRDELVRALSIQLPASIVVDEVALLAAASKDHTKAMLYLRDLGRIFEVERNPLTLSSEEVKIRDIGVKIHQKEVKIAIK